jgi:hypothetical protein
MRSVVMRGIDGAACVSIIVTHAYILEGDAMSKL